VAWGYSDVDKLYRDASSQDNLKYIDVPFMVLSAHDDPIA
jgi:predicted alpha/beta-fold hydrolase